MSVRANMLKSSKEISAYKETSVRTASGGKIIVMLYEEAIKQLDGAIDLLKAENRPLDQINNRILKAQDIVTELMVSLDFDKGGEIAPKLFGLYRYFNDQLMEANINKNPQPLEAVRQLMGELRDAWVQILGKTHVQGEGVGGVDIAG